MDQLPAALTRFVPDILEAHAAMILRALLALPIATAIGALLAFRPRRRGTPPRSAPVIQTQIILAVVGAVVMLIVGASLARAFGIVGAANLIRYRAKIDDPKDASVMLAALGVGLASGVGLFWLAPFATVFILALLWLLESREPEATSPFLLTIKTKDAARLHRRVEATLRRHHIEYEPRSRSADELVYATNVPLERGTENISSAIVHLGQTDQIAVNWSEHKSKR